MPYCSLWCVLPRLSTTSVFESNKYLKSSITKHCCCTKTCRTGYRATQSHDLNIHKTCHLHLLRQQPHEVRPPRRASHVRLADETAKPVALQRNGRFFVRKAGAPAGPSVAAKRRCLLPCLVLLYSKTKQYTVRPRGTAASLIFFWVLTLSEGCFWTGNSQ